MKKLLSALLLAAALLSAQSFKIGNPQNLTLQFKGQTVVTGESCALFPQGGFPETPLKPTRIGTAEVYNAFGEKDGIKYRRELSLDRDELEISVHIDTPPYCKTDVNGKPGYQLRLPMALFKGARFTAITGRASRTSEIHGRLAPGQFNGLFGNTVRALYLSGDFGDLAIDCNPHGINAFGDYGPGYIVGLWNIALDGDSIVLTQGIRQRSFGGDCVTKIVIYEGTPEDFDRRHSHREYPYYDVLDPERNYAFGGTPCGEKYTRTGAARYTPETACGWTGAGKLAAAAYGKSGALYSALVGKTDNTFRISNLRQGFHLITVAASAGKKAVGPFDLSCNGKVWARGVTVEPDHVKTVSFGAWIDRGVAEIGFHGKDWCVSTIATQLLQTTHEDYTFRRGFWVDCNAPCPSVMYAPASYPAEPRYSVKTETFFRPEAGKEMAAPIKTFEYPSCHAEFKDDAEDWRWKYTITSLGPSNGGNFLSLGYPEYVQRAFDEHQAKKAKLIILNGLLSRHTFPTHIPRVRKAIQTAAKAAHDRGMLIMDHIDFSLLWNMDGGFRVLAEDMPSLQMTVDTHLPARGICLTNPDYFERFLALTEKIVTESHLDGIMIDEVTFHGIDFCGCQHCRDGFHQDTGWYLPVDETSPHLFNRSSPLWHAWVLWRQKRVGDFWHRFKTRMKRHNPKFVAVGYTTHYGLTDPWASVGQAITIEQTARGWDVVGTEIMPRNIFACYRSVHAYRKLKNYFRNSMDLPVYGNVYVQGDNWNLLYFGWALCNLNGQLTWPSSPSLPKPGDSDFRTFTPEKGDMDRQHAQTIAKIGILYSTICRDWPEFNSYKACPLGCSMLMSSRHLDHDFLSNLNLDQKRLAKYKVFIVNDGQSLADETVRELLAFARNGGTLLLTRRTGMKGGLATPREKWAFADAFHGLAPDFSRNLQIRVMSLNGKDYAFEEPVIGLRVKGALPQGVRAIGTIAVQPGAKALGPLVYEVACGKGRILYTPIDLGHAIWHEELMVGRPFDGKRNSVCEAAANALLDLGLQGQNSWEPGDTPEAVLTGLFKVNGKIAVHFLNATGSNLKDGEVIAFDWKGPVFPPLARDITFAVFTDKATRAYAVSPDFEGRKPLQITPVSQGKFQIHLPKQHLKAYTIVYVE